MFEKREELLDAVDYACYQIVHMAKPVRAKQQESLMKKLGTPLKAFGPEPLAKEKSGHPAFGWKLSDEARRDIEAIENNARTSLHRIGHIIVR